MRKELAKALETRTRFTGTFAKFGLKNGYMGPERVVLLTDIKDASGEITTDHLWFNYTKGFKSLDLKENDTVEFVARVKTYQKGYKGYRHDVHKPIETDYKLSHPTQLRIVMKGDL